MIARFLAPLALISAPALAQGEQEEKPVDPRAQDMAWHSAQQSYLHGLTAADGWHLEAEGVRWRWLDYRASDEQPRVNNTVKVHYEGKLTDGTVFDSSFARNKPETFPLGGLIKGWQIAIPKMGVGETIEIVIPADGAYGPVGRGPIPPNATLIFKVELIAIES